MNQAAASAASKTVLPAEPSHTPPAVSPGPASMPRSPEIGRTIQRIRSAEIQRRDLQQEAERLQRPGKVLQGD